MKRKIIALCLVIAMLGVAIISGTMAYFTDTAEAVNVMTLGKVDIELIEEKRPNDQVTTVDPKNMDTLDPNTGYHVVPAVYLDGITWQDNTVDPNLKIFNVNMKNVFDKFVSVKNTGRSDAYVRLFFAFEDSDKGLADKLHISFTNDAYFAPVEVVPGEVLHTTINGELYEIYSYTYADPIKPGEQSEYSLKQFFFNKTTTNEDVAAAGDEYTILVLAQAIQASGFNNAAEALNEGFGVPSALTADPADEATLLNVEAWLNGVYANYEKTLLDKWDGTADKTWYNESAEEFVIMTAEQLAGFAKLVDEGKTFEGKTVKLGQDIDLYVMGANDEPVSFDPIGYGYNVVFKGTFDGQGHTISNLYQDGGALGIAQSTAGGGLFASVVDATIKNLTIDNAEIKMDIIDMGTLVGYSYGTTSYENITVKNSVIANRNRYTGGVVGEVNGTQTFKNVDIIDSTVSALWGVYDTGCGGIIGGKWGDAKITMIDCDVSAKLDVFNDACSNYQYYNYRLCGMLIGMSEEVTDGTATASYLTCTNCTVTYGDWMNYTYCEFEANGKGSYAAPDEWKFSRVQEGYATGGVDPNHTHDTDESHEELFAFDQLFGGDKGVRGGKTHAGVTVTYPNP